MKLKEFQRDAIIETTEYIRDFLVKHKTGNPTPQIVLKSPTGSGKTIMAAEILRELSEFFETHDYAIVWVAPNKLHAQSLNKLSIQLADTDYKLQNVDSMTSGALTKNTILFTNWEKLFSQKGGEWTNIRMRRGEAGDNLQDVLDATRANEVGIILIVDESHQTFYGANSQRLVNDVIKPDLVFEISATPRTSTMGGDYHKTEVDFSAVVDSELIKKEIIVNNNIVDSIDDARNSIEVVINAALDKRNALAEKYAEQGLDINPLLLIQLPNEKDAMSELDLKDKAIIEDVLLARGYRYSEKNMAIWLSGEKENLENIEKANSPVDVLIFKQAIALGWDCPRAQVLAMLRDAKSETFRIQTIGRILRMPGAKHYSDDELNCAYVYTDLDSIKVDEEDIDAKNLIKMQVAHIKDGIANIELPSVYIHRTDYGDLRADFKPILENILDQTFDLDSSTISSGGRYQKIDELLEMYDEELTTPIIADVVIQNLDDYSVSEYETLRVRMDAGNIERVFNVVLKGYAGQFKNWARTRSVVCSSLYSWFHKAGIDIERVQKMLACSKENQKIFKQIFDRALDMYDSLNREEMKRRRDRELEELVFSVPEQDVFNENYHIQASPKNAMREYYRKQKAPGTEKKFEQMLDSSVQIDWWYKNGEKMERYFAVPYRYLDEKAKSRRAAFYPDYIIKFKDGTIGIYDTKAGFTANNEHVQQKAEALQRYIAENSKLSLIGGIINVRGDNFYLQDSPQYDQNGEWRPFAL